MIPDDGRFRIFESYDKRLPAPHVAHFRICGQPHTLLITEDDARDIHNAGHRLCAIGLAMSGRVRTYGTP